MPTSNANDWSQLLELMRAVRDEVEQWEDWRKTPELIAASAEAKAVRESRESSDRNPPEDRKATA